MASLEREPKKAIIEEYLIQHPTASLREIGGHLGVSRQRAHVMMKNMGLRESRKPMGRKLTSHQLKILGYVGKGYTNRQIGDVMGCSAKSIDNQLQMIYTKLNVHNRRNAFRQVSNKGLVPSKQLET
jgi:DNA-binding NarL/FixJ family response regulator